MQKFLFIILIFFVSCSQTFIEETQDMVSMKLNVSDNTTDTGIVLNWTSQWDFAKFEILRGTNSNDLILYQTDLAQNEWIDKNNVPGKKYYYQVQAYNNRDRMIGLSKLIAGSRSYPMIDNVDPPSALKASQNEYADQIKLYWFGKENTIFRLYRSCNATTSFELLIETNTLSYNDKDVYPGKKYYYKISSVGQDINNNILEKFQQKPSAEAIEGSTLNAPVGLTATKNDIMIPGGIKLEWTQDPNTEYTKVYRATTKNGAYELISPFVANNNYIDKGLPDVKGKTINNQFVYPKYFYKIIAVKNSQPSEFSASVEGSAIDPDDILPAPQFNYTLDTHSYPYTLHLKWSSHAKIAPLYQLLEIKKNKTNIIIDKQSQTKFKTNNITMGDTIEYIVQVINTKVNNLPGTPAKISYTSRTPAPVIIVTTTTNIRIYSTNIINQTNAETTIYWNNWSNNKKSSMVGVVKKYWKITSQTGFVDLTWKKSVHNDTVEFYNIYRSASQTGTYKKIGHTKEMHFRDNYFTEQEYRGKQIRGKFSYPKYYYKITANFSGQESAFSTVEVGGAINPKDILPAPSYLSIPFHWANGFGFKATLRKGDKSPIGIEQIKDTYVGFNKLWLTWEKVNNATTYQVRHSRGEEQQHWYTHTGIGNVTKLLIGNEITSGLTGLYVFTDSWGYSKESVSFDIAPINGNAGDLIGDQIGIWFTEPVKKPDYY